MNLGRSLLARAGMALFLASAVCASPTTPGTLTSYATSQCIGFQWNIEGDANHNAACLVSYRVSGGGEWKTALPLFRVDYQGYYGSTTYPYRNMFAGSIMFLQPGTTYDVRLELSDPDGGAETRILAVATRALPALPQGGRTFHVTPGTGGGAGTSADPFRGLATAEAAAQAGDIFLLHAGDYGVYTFAKSGAAGNRIVWKGADDGDPLFYRANVAGSHLWFQGLRFNSQSGYNYGLVRNGSPVNVVVSHNTFTGYSYSIQLGGGCQDWIITDNYIWGDKPMTWGVQDPNALSGEGVELGESIGGHEVGYNYITHVADGVSYPGRDTDIYGNEIVDVTDDALEPDRGYSNIRIWGNRLTGFNNSAISFQPMACGPWYIVRNQLVGITYIDNETRMPAPFKFRIQDRFLMVNNTFVNPQYFSVYMDAVFTSFCRNNLFISSTGAKPIWIGMRYPVPDPDPRNVLPLQYPSWMTDVDYDGFDWGADSTRWDRPVFRYDRYADIHLNYFIDLGAFAASTGIETHGIHVRKEDIFENWSIPVEPARIAPQMLALRAGSNAIDTGVVVPNISDDYAGAAPDLGALELGKPLPHYGPRPLMITASAGPGGAIQPGGVISVAHDASQVFAITPNEGWRVLDVTVDGLSRGAVNAWNFPAVRSDHVIEVAFEAIPTTTTTSTTTTSSTTTTEEPTTTTEEPMTTSTTSTSSTTTTLPVDCIVDNADNSAERKFLVVSGTWTTGTGLADKYGPDYRACSSTTGAATARSCFSAAFLPAGTYQVYAWWTVYSTRSATVPYVVAGSTVLVNQSVNGGRWNLLGTFAFSEGGHVVEVHNGQTGSSKSICADAVRFVRVNDAVTTSTQQAPTTTLPAPLDLVIDNTDTAAEKKFQTTLGTWNTGTSLSDKYGADYRTCASTTGAVTARAAWSTTLLPAGSYAVYAWWSVYSTRSTAAPYVINGVTVAVDQTLNGGRWNLLGVFGFSGTVTVEVHNGFTGSGKSICADAIRFMKVGDIITTTTLSTASTTTLPAPMQSIIDNRDASPDKQFQILLGTWTTGTSLMDKYGPDYLVCASSSGTATARSRFSTTLLPAGSYEVYAWWAQYSSRSTASPFVIKDGAAQLATVQVDQTVNGGKWNLLGVHTFSGGGHSVEVHNAGTGTGKSVCADAVKFVKVGP